MLVITKRLPWLCKRTLTTRHFSLAFPTVLVCGITHYISTVFGFNRPADRMFRLCDPGLLRTGGRRGASQQSLPGKCS